MIVNVQPFYNSWSGYNDELVWGWAWVARATRDALDWHKADALYDSLNNGRYDQFSWDEKTLGTQMVLYQLGL